MSNYYLVLGVDKDADLDKIKRAYRFYCKKYHPDLSLKEQKKKFLKIQEAYETLSDEEKRRTYDQSLEKTEGHIPVTSVQDRFWEEKQNRNRRIKRFSSILDDFFEGFVSGFFDEEFSGDKELYLELILTPGEARQGGDFPIDVPVIEECSACSGRGYVNQFICSFCSGSGTIHEKRRFTLHVPPRISTGSTAKVPLEGIGLQDVYLYVEVIVQPF